MKPDTHLLQVVFHQEVAVKIAPSLAILVRRYHLVPFHHRADEIGEGFRK